MTHPVPFHRVSLDTAEIDSVVSVLRSGWLTSGAEVRAFEAEFAAHIGTREALAVSSGTAALHLMLAASGIGPGDEVIVPAQTFTATAASVVHVGARPVVADIDPITLNLAPAEVAKQRTQRTKAVIAVHFAGVRCELEQIRSMVGESCLVFEDAAHALPTWNASAHCGTESDGAAFSFYATKTLSTGEGGMLVLRDPQAMSRARSLVLHGMSNGAFDRYASGSWRYDVGDFGFKYNMTDIAGALGRGQLKSLERRRNERAAIADTYDRAFAAISALQIPFRRDAQSDSWHLYVLRLNLEQLDCGRDEILDELRNTGIGVNVHFIPLHLHSAYQKRFGLRPGDFPVAEMEFQRMMSLPLWSGMTSTDIESVIEAVRGVVARHTVN